MKKTILLSLFLLVGSGVFALDKITPIYTSDTYNHVSIQKWFTHEGCIYVTRGHTRHGWNAGVASVFIPKKDCKEWNE